MIERAVDDRGQYIRVLDVGWCRSEGPSCPSPGKRRQGSEDRERWTEEARDTLWDTLKDWLMERLK